MAEDLSSVVQAWVPRHHMCVLRHRMWVPRHRTPCRPTRPQGWDAPRKLRERWCHPLTCPLMRGERASLETSALPSQVPVQDLGYAAENARGCGRRAHEARSCHSMAPSARWTCQSAASSGTTFLDNCAYVGFRATRQRRVRGLHATRQHRVARPRGRQGGGAAPDGSTVAMGHP